MSWIDHLWQSTLFGLAVLLFLALARALPARLRRTLAWIGLAKFAVPAAWFTPLIRALDPTAAARHWFAPAVLPPTFGRAAHLVATSPVLPAGGFLSLAQAIWLAGVAAFVLVLAFRACTLHRRLLTDSAPAPDELCRRLDRAAALAGFARTPPCRMIRAEESPGVLGLLHPVILVPRGLDRSMTPEELDAVLLHECVHAARRDNLGALIQAALVALNWYNPVVWLLSGRLDRETEMACDERVLAELPDKEAYLSSLAKTVRHSLGLLHAGFAPAGSTPMGERLGHIQDFRRSRAPAWLGGAVVAAAVLAAILTGYLGSITSTLDPGSQPYSLAAEDEAPPQGLVLELVAPPHDGLPASALDEPPAALRQATPAYPPGLYAARISGDAIVSFTVSPSGVVKDAVVEGYSRAQFGAASLAAIKQWHYRPGEKDGRPVAAVVRIHFIFSAATSEVVAEPEE